MGNDDCGRSTWLWKVNPTTNRLRDTGPWLKDAIDVEMLVRYQASRILGQVLFTFDLCLSMTLNACSPSVTKQSALHYSPLLSHFVSRRRNKPERHFQAVLDNSRRSCISCRSLRFTVCIPPHASRVTNVAKRAPRRFLSISCLLSVSVELSLETTSIVAHSQPKVQRTSAA